MNGFNLLLAGYAVGCTLALLIFVSMRRTTTPPAIVVQQERPYDDSLGCGAFLMLVVAVAGAILLAIVLNQG